MYTNQHLVCCKKIFLRFLQKEFFFSNMLKNQLENQGCLLMMFQLARKRTNCTLLSSFVQRGRRRWWSIVSPLLLGIKCEQNDCLFQSLYHSYFRILSRSLFPSSHCTMLFCPWDADRDDFFLSIIFFFFTFLFVVLCLLLAVEKRHFGALLPQFGMERKEILLQCQQTTIGRNSRRWMWMVERGEPSTCMTKY